MSDQLSREGNGQFSAEERDVLFDITRAPGWAGLDVDKQQQLQTVADLFHGAADAAANVTPDAHANSRYSTWAAAEAMLFSVAAVLEGPAVVDDGRE